MSRAISASVLRRCRSVAQKGAGDSGQTIRPGVVGLSLLWPHAQRLQRAQRLLKVVERPVRIRGWECWPAPGSRPGRWAELPGFISFPACSAIAAASEAVKQHLAPGVRNQERRGDGGVHQRDLERNSVDPGDGRDARERNVVDLRGAEQVPGKAGDVGARQSRPRPRGTA